MDGILKNLEITTEEKIYCYKMKADHYRYISELKGGKEKAKDAESTIEAMRLYKDAYKVAKRNMGAVRPEFLAVVLNYSVFLYEIADDENKALSKARRAFDNAVIDIEIVAEKELDEVNLLL
mmetsp:Transcript_3072/g.2048  ORF Transcript_3072/g.2048 Transcript_3072/m.2048 type:complete len:122 (+) Transcript_3072:381-746(+)|eukprot:CAMPEP_0116883080 /NCGR_PEP_ID=MMETSP0463-20121206/15511_1 /TAXON_ID=181622 /ORGANISM="Strombidinopsis sp, Strain SopsisLIS2011" /LENGTH=121 /DNA_ID=CAMNT_0004537305 /DNA_START=301 /DNA_END=666 /DNA_ORIENTATION=-